MGFCSGTDPTNTLALVMLFVLTERLSGAKDTLAGQAVIDTCFQSYTIPYSHFVLMSSDTLRSCVRNGGGEKPPLGTCLLDRKKRCGRPCCFKIWMPLPRKLTVSLRKK